LAAGVGSRRIDAVVFLGLDAWAAVGSASNCKNWLVSPESEDSGRSRSDPFELAFERSNSASRLLPA
jgi:hypothetical protein